MSANDTTITVSEDGAWTTFGFSNQIPIPSYLIALAIGDIEYKSLGDRVGVVTEPAMMEAVATELEDMAILLDEVEKYAGPYIWGNYTIIVLPPSFPMGGMENPLLTFASPTIIVGDKSQVYVATHEMAHSWTGNEITCRDWENFWLNEGWTVFLERKVSSRLHGVDFGKVEALLGNTSMWQDMNSFGLGDTFSSIHPVLAGRNPDSSFSELPYEKGFQFLTHLESLIGEDNFEAFAKYYVRQHSLTSITSLEFRSSWESFVEREIGLSPEEVNKVLTDTNFDWWVNNVGGPTPESDPTFDFSTPQSIEATELANQYVALGGSGSPENFEDYFTYYSNLKVVFHDQL